MEINPRKDGGVNLSFSPKETRKFLDHCLCSQTCGALAYFYNLYIEIKKAKGKTEEKVLPIFILAGNLHQARYYAKKNKIKNIITSAMPIY